VIASRNPELARADAGAGAEGLRAIAKFPGQWRAINASFVVAIGMTAVGFVAIASSLGGVPIVAAAVFIAGAAGMLAYLLFHLTATVGAARDTNAASDYEERRRRFARFYSIYMVLAYSSFVVLGSAFVQGARTQPWIGWLAIVAGTFGTVTMVVRRPVVGGLVVSDLPLWIHVIAAVIGGAIVWTGAR
jgi:hypothetical protein